MIRNRALYLGKWFGTTVHINWSFLLLFLFIVLMAATSDKVTDLFSAATYMLSGTIFLLVVLMSVLLHEFGHILAAKYYKFSTPDITLYIFGGLANIGAKEGKSIWSAKEEFFITMGGLMVSAFLYVVAWNAYTYLPETLLLSPILFMVWKLNLILLIFNIIPAFPMDGGRLLRSTCKFFTGHLRATYIARYVGIVACIGFVVWGIINIEPMIVIIAFLVFLWGGAELQHAKQLARARFEPMVI